MSDVTKTQEQGMANIDAVAKKLGGRISDWVQSGENWKYADLTIGASTMRIGTSTGGVVSVNGDPFTPDSERHMNITEKAVMTSVKSVLNRVIYQQIVSVKGAVTDQSPFSNAPKDWIVMNAARPILGSLRSTDGKYPSGKFYAAIDPTDEFAVKQIDANIKDGASIVFVADAAMQTAMALNCIDLEHVDAYLEMDSSERDKAIKPLINCLNGMPYGELVVLAEKGMPESMSAALSPS